VLKSTYADQPKMNLVPIVINEITIVGSRCGPFQPAIRLLEKNSIDVLSLVSERFPLEEGARAIQAAKKKETLKVILDIGKN